MDQTSSDLGVGPAQPSSALGASVKVKKKSARVRASNSSQINLIDKKQLLHLNTTSWKVNGGSSSFNPKFQFTSAVEVGKIIGRSDQCESGGVFQADTYEGVGISSRHHEELQNRDSCFRRSSLKGDDQPLVVGSHHRHNSRGVEEVSLGGDSSDSLLPMLCTVNQ